jgi:hypothetical protein
MDVTVVGDTQTKAIFGGVVSIEVIVSVVSEMDNNIQTVCCG